MPSVRILAASAALTLLTSVASAQTVGIATGPQATPTNATGSAIAKVMNEATGLQTRAVPNTSNDIAMPGLNRGQVDFAIASVDLANTAFLGIEQFDGRKLGNVRIVAKLFPLNVGIVVRKDSNIKTGADLKGKRVSGVFSGQPVIRVLSGAAMGAYGLSYNDVSVVPAVNVVQGVAAVVDGRADAAWASPAMPQIRQAHAKVGVRFIPLSGITPEQEDTIRKQAFPSVYVDKFGGPQTPWLPAGTPMLTQEMYLGASTKTTDDVVKQVLAALWSAEADLMKAHPVMRGFANKAAVTTRPGVPYHPAAIAFYKEKGVWTKEAEAANAAVMKK